MQKSEDLWKLVLEQLQISVSEASYASWITPLELASIQETGSGVTATVLCPSSFHRSIIDQRYLPDISQTLSQLLSKPVDVEVMVDTRDRKRNLQQASYGSFSEPLFHHTHEQADELQLAIHRVGLKDHFTFEHFAVSSSNEMAHAAAVAVAEHFGKAYNPLFIYGGVGVGKTHLSQAVAIKYLENNPRSQMIFCASEEFTNGIIEAIQQKTTQEFRRRYRQVKGLFIDDIQFIAGKTTVQEEFFHTFNAVLKGGGQVVLTSDRPPHEINNLEARLRSRFEAGLLVDIGMPDFELRSAIVLIKAKQRSLSLSIDQARTIAANIESARQIEGFLYRLITESNLRKKSIDDALIHGLLGKTVPVADDSPPPLRPLEVIKGVAELHSLTSKEVRGKRRKKHIVKARHIAMYLLRVDYNMALTEIGDLFSQRDHTTVMHAVEKITMTLKDSESLRVDVADVRSRLYT